jgi:thiamine biosynthesis protein ThiS
VSGIRVAANGKPHVAQDGSSVAALLSTFGLSANQVIVEYNGEPLPREQFASTPLHEGDRIEIAQMVGGG